MTVQQRQLIATEVASSKKLNVNSYWVAKRIQKVSYMASLSVNEIESEILRLCPKFNSL